MATHTLPGIGLTGGFVTGEDGWGDAMDANLVKLSTLTQGAVLDRVAAVPGSPTQGDAYILTAAPHDKAVAVYDAGAWVYFTPIAGWLIYDQDAEVYLTFDGAAWAELATGGGGGGGIEEAPEDGNTYGRKDGAWEYIPAGGSGGDSIEALIRKGMVDRATSAFTNGSNISFVVEVGDDVAIAQFLYTDSGAYINGETYTVPAGKKAYLTKFVTNQNARTNPTFYKQQTYNITTNDVIVEPTELGWVFYEGLVAVDAANDVQPWPVPAGVAGDVLTLRGCSAGDGNSRTINGYAIYTLVDD